MNQEKNSHLRPSATEEEQGEQDSHQSKSGQQRPAPASSPAQPAETEPAGHKTRPMAPYQAPETGGPLPDLDEGPRPGPVDDIQEALFEAARQGASAKTDFDDLPEPVPDLDEGPRPGPVDDIQEALFEAAQKGAPTEVDFDELPGPGPTFPQKIIRFARQAISTEPAEAPKVEPKAEPAAEAEPAPLPTFPEPEPVPTVADFWLLLALFLTFRLLTLFLLRPGGFIRDWSDFDTYLGIAALSDYSLFPYLDFWLEWPPLLPWLAVGAYKLALLIPPWTDDPRLWFILILGSLFVLFEAGNFVLIYRLARRLFQSPVAVGRVMWLYAGLFPPIYAMLGFFDGVALFFMLLALDLLLDERRISSAISVSIGFMLKIVPVLMLPVALRRLWHQHQEDRREAGIELGLYGVVFGLAVLVILGPFFIAGPQWILASVRAMLGRASWETVWALIEGYYGFGVVLGDRLNPAETNFAVHESFLPWWLIFLVFAGIYTYLFTRPADFSRPRNLIAFGGLTVTIFMLYSKGYSPQFLVYLLPFILLLFPDGRGLIYALIFTGLNVLEQPVYFVLLPRDTWLLTFTVIARFIMTIVLALEFARIIWPLAERFTFVGAAYQKVPTFVGAAGLLSLVILTPVTLHAYTADRMAHSPVATFVSFMQTQTQTGPNKPRLLLSDQATYRELYPFLHDDFDLQLADGPTRYSGAPGVTDLIKGLDTVWVLPTGPQQRALSNAISRRAQPVATFDFEGLGAASLYSFTANVTPFIAPARFAGGIELLAHKIEVRRGVVDVTLYWRARNPQTQSLTVFTQVINADGQRVAGHDSLPQDGTAPTTGWTVDAVQADSHRIELPAGLPPGGYTIVAGLYNAFNERLTGIDPSGLGFTNRAVPLEVVQLP